MTRRALRIATILIIIQSLLFFPTPVSHAQDRPIQAELILAQEVSDLFMKRLDETGDFTSVIDEMYAEDFIERYLQERISEEKQSNSFSDDFFAPGLEYKTNLLKQATVQNWKRLYIAVNNFMYWAMVNSINKHADDILNGRETDDELIDEKIIPPNVIALFNNRPALKGFLGLDDWIRNHHEGSQSDAAEEESGPKSIETPEEMQDVTETIQEGLRLMLEEHGNLSPRLTESAKSALEVFRLDLGELMKPTIEVFDKKFLGLPPGTPILSVPTPFMFWLVIAEVKGKQKIIWVAFHIPSC